MIHHDIQDVNYPNEMRTLRPREPKTKMLMLLPTPDRSRSSDPMFMCKMTQLSRALKPLRAPSRDPGRKVVARRPNERLHLHLVDEAGDTRHDTLMARRLCLRRRRAYEYDVQQAETMSVVVPTREHGRQQMNRMGAVQWRRGRLRGRHLSEGWRPKRLRRGRYRRTRESHEGLQRGRRTRRAGAAVERLDPVGRRVVEDERYKRRHEAEQFVPERLLVLVVPREAELLQRVGRHHLVQGTDVVQAEGKT